MDKSYYNFLYYIIPTLCTVIISFSIVKIFPYRINDSIGTTAIIVSLILLLYYSIIEHLLQINQIIRIVIQKYIGSTNKKRTLSELAERNKAEIDDKYTNLRNMLCVFLQPYINYSDFELFMTNIQKFDIIKDDIWYNLKDCELSKLNNDNIIKVINSNEKLNASDIKTIGFGIGKIINWQRNKTAILLKVSFDKEFKDLCIKSIISSLSENKGEIVKIDNIKEYIS